MTQGYYEIPSNPDLPRDFLHRYIQVGPFRVLVRNKQHYRLYTCDVLGVEILKQASLPAVEDLLDGLSYAVEKKVLTVREVEALRKEASSSLSNPYAKSKTQSITSHSRPTLKRKGVKK